MTRRKSPGRAECAISQTLAKCNNTLSLLSAIRVWLNEGLGAPLVGSARNERAHSCMYVVHPIVLRFTYF